MDTAMNQTFECPHCGAALTAHGSGTVVKCPYCGSQVVVPVDLRAAPPPPPPPPLADWSIPARYGAYRQPGYEARRAMIFGITGLILSCLFFPVGLVFDIIA